MKNNLTLAAVLSATLECASPDLGPQTERAANKDPQAEVRKLSDCKYGYGQRRSLLGKLESMLASEELNRAKLLEKIAAICRDMICRLDFEGAEA